MLMQQRLGLRLAQKPVLTQSLRQLVKLLALNKLELKEEIVQELEENPVLEINTEAESSETSLEQAAEAEEARESETAETEIAGEAFDDIDLASFFDDYLDAGPRGPAPEVVEKPSFEMFLSKATTLTDHLNWQLGMTDTSDEVHAAGEELIGNLNEDGYLTISPEEVAASAGISLSQVSDALALVQEMDPLGVAAVDLQDCLLIQLRSADASEGVAGLIVRGEPREQRPVTGDVKVLHRSAPWFVSEFPARCRESIETQMTARLHQHDRKMTAVETETPGTRVPG